MNASDVLSHFLAPFIQQLYQSGVRHVVVSPGSRSTPLTVLFREHEGIKTWINVDERSAGFFALGIAKAYKEPVALVCSSGTASANYFPALIEAKYSEVPLIVLTADRPHELREVGAPQAIDQIKLYGNHVKLSTDMPLPEMDKGLIQYGRQQAAEAVRLSTEAPKGPVHLNFPFREPLMPNVQSPIPWETAAPIIVNHKSDTQVNTSYINDLVKRLVPSKRLLIVIGPDYEEALSESLLQLAEVLQAPIIADPLSQMRAGNHEKKWVLDGYDAFLRSPSFVETYKADGILRFGAMPVSKPFLKYLERLDLPLYMVVSSGGRRSDPTHQVTDWVKATPSSFIKEVVQAFAAKLERTPDVTWAENWLKVNALTQATTRKVMEADSWFEGHVVSDLLPELPDNAFLFASNSMPIRDLDSFLLNNPKPVQTFGNRGANGIDGINSTALGLSSSQKPTYLIIGDLSFFHDTNGLMVGKQYDLDLTCIVVNNNGGGIFSFLPQSESATHFEELFSTPLNVSVSDVATLYKAHYFSASNREAYQEALKKAKTVKGLKLIECLTHRETNVALHKSYWKEIQTRVEDEVRKLETSN